MNRDPKQEVDEELRFHLEQRTRDYLARGMSPEAAREAAAQRFGDTARVSEACTSVLLAERAAEERRALVKVSWLDVKLGLRMLAKYPGLSLVAVGGMAIAIAFGAGYFALVGSFLDSRVPIERGDRVVMIRNRYVQGPDATGTGRIGDVGPAAFDFRQWQDRVKSVRELSAFRDDKRNLYVGVLAVVAAVLIGVLPALKATGKRVQAGLQQFSSRGAGVQLGRTWTALIVVQVAFAVAALPGTIFKAAGLLRMGTLPPAAAAARLLRGTLLMPSGSGTTPDAQFAERMTTLIQRTQEQPEVSAVTFAGAIPGSEGRGVIEPESPSALIQSRVNFVATNLFDVFDVRILSGRGFTAADTHPKSPAVIVDQAFAARLAPGGNVIGRRIRFAVPDGASAPNPWMEIVGVVPVFSSSFTPSAYPGPPPPSLYRAVAPGGSHPVTFVVQVRSGDPALYGQKLQEITASVDPTMEVEFVAGVAELWEREQRGMRLLALIVIAVNASVLLLSAAGIHAMMSFTVGRRWREIGIRVALGADARRVLMGILGRASAQIGAGVAAGLTLAGILEWVTPGGNVGGKALILFPTVAAVMFAVGLLAAAGPARRGLAIEPTEALRSE